MPKISKRIVENQGRELLLLVHEYLNDVQDGTVIEHADQPEVKKPKEKTHEYSFRLYKEGKSPQEIADIRGLNVGTIYGHLEKFLENGEVCFKDLVSDSHYNKIKNYLSQHPRSENTTLTDLRKEIGEDISFSDLRLTMKYLDLKNRYRTKSRIRFLIRDFVLCKCLYDFCCQ